MGVIFRNGVAFGGGGENSRTILADENTILVGDGDNWSKENNGYLYAGADNRDSETSRIFTKKVGLVLGGTLGTENLINELRITDNSNVAFQGQSRVQIGERHQDYSNSGVYFGGNLLKGPNVRLAGNAYIDMSQFLTPSDNPLCLIKGDAYIDIMSNPGANEGKTNRYGNHLSDLAKELYGSNDFYSPWGELIGSTTARHKIYPYLHFWGSPTILMDGAPLIKMSGGSSLLMEGSPDVRFVGTESKKTHVFLENGVNVKMSSNDPNKNVLLIIENDDMSDSNNEDANYLRDQIWLATDYKRNGIVNMGVEPNSFYGGTHKYRNLLGDGTLLTYKGPWFTKVTNPSLSSLDYLSGSALLIQGKSHIEIGDTGRLALRIAAASGSDLAMDWTTFGTTDIKIGGGEDSFLWFDATRGKNSQMVVKIGAEEGSQVCYAIEPHGKTSIKFAPSNVMKTGDAGTALGPYYDWSSFNEDGIFHLSCTPNITDMIAQWEYNESIFEGIDTFFQVEGFAHGEMHDGSTLIMRGSGSKPYLIPSVGIGEAVTILTTTQYPDQVSIDQLSDTDFDSFIAKIEKQYSNLKIKYLDGGQVSSVDYYTDKYSTTVSGINFTHNLSGVRTQTSNYYSSNAEIITYVVIPWLQYLYPNAVISDVQVTSFERRWTGSEYWYGNITGSARVTNATLTKNISNYYEDGDFSTLSEEDQNIFTSAYASYTNVDFSNATFTQELRSDMLYSTTISQYSCFEPGDTHHTHLCNNWNKPIQSERNREEAVDGPVIQVYDKANLFMGRQARYGSYLATIIPSPVGNYDFTGTAYEDIYRRIEQLKNCADYETFVELSQPGAGYKIGKILGVDEASGGGILVRYEPWIIGWYDHVQANGTDPVFEMIDNAELRLGTNAYLEVSKDMNPDSQTYGEICLTVGDTNDSAQRATISVNQIKQLLSLLN